jgi:hypothetical protein
MRNKLRQRQAYALVIVMLLHVFLPPAAKALTGGPMQPEFSAFEPIGTTEMVNLPDGDFTYNIPLLDVGGYPLNLAYHSGITQDMEASVVGLGWTINPGTINRNVRALPDDFRGEDDAVRKELNMRPNVTVGVGVSGSTELFGKKITSETNPGATTSLKLGLGLKLGVFVNNYKGIGYDFGLSPAFNAARKAEKGLTGKLGMDAGLGVNSKDGANFSADVSFDGALKRKEKSSLKLKGGIGLEVSSKEGLKYLKLESKVPFLKSKRKLSHKFSYSGKTYVPGMDFSHNNLSLSFNFKPNDLALFGSSISIAGFSGYYSQQTLRETSSSKRAYGLLYAEEGKDDVHALMDFNREHEGALTGYSINLPLVNPGYDVLNLSGQGIGGSYQLKRSDVPIFFDSKSTSVANGGGIGIEMGKGGLFHGGTNLSYNNTNSFAEKWSKDNEFLSAYDFGDGSEGAYEAAYYRAAGEMAVETDLNFYRNLGEDQPVRAYLEQPDFFKPFQVFAQPKLVDDYDNEEASPASPVTRNQRARRNQVISYLTAEEASVAGLQKVLPSHPLNDFSASPYDLPRIDGRVGRQHHHISQIESVREDGLRYVYGIPAYNLTTEEVSFNVAGRSVDCQTGNVIYAPDQDDSVDNDRGSDHYYNKTTTPAYAHSYLLTAVLGQDYEDVGNDGPSEDDLGTYTQINYSNTTLNLGPRRGMISPYQWRVPFQKDGAHYNAGFFTKKGDDKASYVYGQKEIWLVHSVESKTMIAEFFYEEDRQDGFGVVNRHGGFAPDNPNKVLKKVTLYSKPDRKMNGDDATPIKTVHFNYNYELCPGTLNSRAGGKLTLKEVYFTYGHSQKGKLSSYKFSYKNPAAPYDGRAYDRWGNFLPNNQNNNCQKPKPGDPIPNDEFPYSTQDPVLAESVAGTWCLNHIKLPSGGEINVEYGAKHYAYVQDQPAMQMVKIIGTNAPDGKSLYEDKNTSYLRLTLDLGGGSIEDYLRGIRKNKDYVYLRCYLNLNGKTGSDAKYEYVSLYAKVFDYKADWIELVALPIRDAGPEINPISKFGFQFVREHLPKIAFGETTVKPEDINLRNPLAFLRPMAAIGRQLRSFVQGFNSVLIDRGYCKQIDVQGRSYVRLMTPDGMKYGGGGLVKRITITDNWEKMTDGVHKSFTYGQEYDYTTIDPVTGKRISSGVAAYEPILGGDENPMRQPIEVNEERRWAIDNIHYVEEPLGEALMPGPRIVYGEIRVQNLSRPNVNRTATGHSVLKYYTAKDFPVKVDRTDLSKKPRRMRPILNILKLKVKDHMTASQGFVVETNNMHGQAKGREVYDANGTLISSVGYHYKTKPDSTLDNSVEVMGPDGELRPAQLGVDYDLAGDAREAKTKTISAGAQINVDGFTVALLPIVVPMVWPSFEQEEKRFRSMSLTKQVKKYGVLDRVEAFDLGSSIATENRVWDAETGEVLLTKTYNEFEDPVYNLKIPAHLYYVGMQGAYQNIGATATLTNLGGGSYAVPDGDLFIPGDEVLVSNTGPLQKAWVLHANAVFNKIFLIDANGNPESTFGTGTTAKVIRSGHRNMPTAAIGTVTSLQNPFVGNRLSLDQNSGVLNAEAVEYSDQWQTFCSDETVEGRNCFPEGQVNPFTRGIWGNWRTKRSWLYLTERQQQPLAGTTSSTNLREDGVYEDFSAFWQYVPGQKVWSKEDAGWEWTTEVTKINPNGTELENRDRLDRHAAEILGYYNQLVTGVAANSKYHQIAFEGFEDYHYNENVGDNLCPLERHFGADIDPEAVTKETYHTGKYALEVSPQDKRETFYDIGEPCVTAGSAPEGQPYTMGDCDCVPSFAPEPGRYVVTAWVKEGDGLGAYQYQNHRLRVITRDPSVTNTNDFIAKGKVIEGWQRIEGVFDVSAQDQTVSVVFESTGNDVVFFDDLRIFPYDGDMKNFVYDDVSLKLLSEIDANGYASFYEYDASGQLVRIKKETERGLMTVQESASALPKTR